MRVILFSFLFGFARVGSLVNDFAVGILGFSF